MNDNENINDMITRFIKITNGLFSLGDSIDNDQNVRMVIRALPQSWEVKSTTLKKLNDKEEMNFMGLIKNFKTHEMEKKLRKTMLQKKRALLSKLLQPLKSLSKMTMKNYPYW